MVNAGVEIELDAEDLEDVIAPGYNLNQRNSDER
jgi:hypothetical protein